MHIRPMREADVDHLDQIDPTYVSRSYLHVEVEEGGSLGRSFRLVEREVCPPEVHGDGNRYGAAEQAHARQSLLTGDGLLLVVEHEGRIVGALEVETRLWNNTAVVWLLVLSPIARGKGVGAQLIAQGVAWAQARYFRAIWLETQTSNLPACRFYARCGFQLAGLDTMFYTNEDVANGSVALFWSLNLVAADDGQPQVADAKGQPVGSS